MKRNVGGRGRERNESRMIGTYSIFHSTSHTHIILLASFILQCFLLSSLLQLMESGEAGETGRIALPPALLKAQLQSPGSGDCVSATVPHLPETPLATAAQETAKITKTVKDCHTVHVREVEKWGWDSVLVLVLCVQTAPDSIPDTFKCN